MHPGRSLRPSRPRLLRFLYDYSTALCTDCDLISQPCVLQKGCGYEDSVCAMNYDYSSHG